MKKKIFHCSIQLRIKKNVSKIKKTNMIEIMDKNGPNILDFTTITTVKTANKNNGVLFLLFLLPKRKIDNNKSKRNEGHNVLTGWQDGIRSPLTNSQHHHRNHNLLVHIFVRGSSCRTIPFRALCSLWSPTFCCTYLLKHN